MLYIRAFSQILKKLNYWGLDLGVTKVTALYNSKDKSLFMCLSERSFKSCIFSWFFLWHLLWLSIMQLRHYLFIGTLNPMLNHLTAGNPSLSTYKHTQTHTYPVQYTHVPINILMKCMLFLSFSLVSKYTNAFAFTQLCGILCAPWNGLIMDRNKGRPRKSLDWSYTIIILSYHDDFTIWLHPSVSSITFLCTTDS